MKLLKPDIDWSLVLGVLGRALLVILAILPYAAVTCGVYYAGAHFWPKLAALPYGALWQILVGLVLLGVWVKAVALITFLYGIVAKVFL